MLDWIDQYQEAIVDLVEEIEMLRAEMEEVGFLHPPAALPFLIWALSFTKDAAESASKDASAAALKKAYEQLFARNCELKLENS